MSAGLVVVVVFAGDGGFTGGSPIRLVRSPGPADRSRSLNEWDRSP